MYLDNRARLWLYDYNGRAKEPTMTALIRTLTDWYRHLQARRRVKATLASITD